MVVHCSSMAQEVCSSVCSASVLLIAPFSGVAVKSISTQYPGFYPRQEHAREGTLRPPNCCRARTRLRLCRDSPMAFMVTARVMSTVQMHHLEPRLG